MKTYIIFDTNILHLRSYNDFSKFVFHQIYEEIQGKIERHDVVKNFELLVPEITIQELFQQQLKAFVENIYLLKDAYSNCQQLYEIDLKIDDSFQYEPYLIKMRHQYLSSKDINILPICNENKFSNIVNRALNKKAPFEGRDKKSDKGFKDALIWESILEFASENEGEYIFITNDKGFQQDLIKEFEQVTHKSISFYNKDERQKLDLHIEKYSEEKIIRMKLKTVQSNIEIYFEDFLESIKSKALNNIQVNGTGCTVTECNLINEIIDLNEIGENIYKFKVNGKIKAGKVGLSYELNIAMDILVDVESTKDLDVVMMKLDGIDASLLAGDTMNIKLEPFEYRPIDAKDENEGDQDDDDSISVEKNDISLEKSDKQSIMEKKVNEYNGLLSQGVYSEFFVDTEYESNQVFLSELIQTIENNLSIDWIKFSSKVAQVKRAIRIFLKKNNFDGGNIETVIQTLLNQIEKDYTHYEQKKKESKLVNK